MGTSSGEKRYYCSTVLGRCNDGSYGPVLDRRAFSTPFNVTAWANLRSIRFQLQHFAPNSVLAGPKAHNTVPKATSCLCYSLALLDNNVHNHKLQRLLMVSN